MVSKIFSMRIFSPLRPIKLNMLDSGTGVHIRRIIRGHFIIDFKEYQQNNDEITPNYLTLGKCDSLMIPEATGSRYSFYNFSNKD